MFRSITLRYFCLLLLTVMALPVHAQDNSDNPDAATARLDVRLSQLEEQMRRTEGTIEQLAYENKQLKAQLDKANSDTQYRLQAIETKLAAAPAPAASNNAPVAATPSSSDNNADTPPVQPSVEIHTPDAVASTSDHKFESSREHYNYAFRLMNQAKYAEAGDSFAAFTKQYPHDPLIGNSFYWLGETYYVRRDDVRAADSFRQGYEAMPSGPKAADNLLKLAMSLDAMKKDTEACVVLKQVVSKYGSASGSVKPRAEQEINRIGCS